VIKQEEHFARTVLPHYFKHNKFYSFVRQLNLCESKVGKGWSQDEEFTVVGWCLVDSMDGEGWGGQSHWGD